MYHVSALEDSTLCYIPIEQITYIVKKNGDFALDFLMKLSKASNSVLAQQLLMKSKNLSGRIALVLLRFAKQNPTSIYKDQAIQVAVACKTNWVGGACAPADSVRSNNGGSTGNDYPTVTYGGKSG